MSGMAVLLLVTMQVDDTGWQSALADLQSPPPASSQTAPALPAGTNSPGFPGQQAVSDAASTVQQFAHEAEARTGSALADIQRALESAVSPQGASSGDTLQDRMRGAYDATGNPPTPPSGRTFSDGASAGSSSADYESMRGRFDPSRAVVPPTSASAVEPGAGAARSSPSAGQSTRSSAGFPGNTGPIRNNTAAGRPDEMDFTAPAGSSGREVIFERHLANDSAANQTYLTPPGRVEAYAPQQSGHLAENPAVAQSQPPATAPPLTLPSAPATNGNLADASPSSGTQAATETRPWGPLLMTVLGLFGSLGFNLYLGWIAWDLYSRYQDAVDDVQDLERKLEAKQQELATRVRHAPPRAPAVASA